MFVWAIFSGGVLLICLLKADEAMGFCMFEGASFELGDVGA